MSKCRRNIILIFGYLLIVVIFFVPTKKVIFDLMGKEKKSTKNITFLPFFIDGVVKNIKFKNWKAKGIPKLNVCLEKIKVKKNENESVDIKLWDIENIYIKTNKEFLTKWNAYKKIRNPSNWDREDLLYDAFAYYRTEDLSIVVRKALNNLENLKRSAENLKNNINNLNNEIAMLQIKSLGLKEKFKQKFGDRPYYRKLRIEYFITELVIILLIGGFAYMLFCVILRKTEK